MININRFYSHVYAHYMHIILLLILLMCYRCKMYINQSILCVKQLLMRSWTRY